MSAWKALSMVGIFLILLNNIIWRFLVGTLKKTRKTLNPLEGNEWKLAAVSVIKEPLTE